jgi:hypothetical protein
VSSVWDDVRPANRRLRRRGSRQIAQPSRVGGAPVVLRGTPTVRRHDGGHRIRNVVSSNANADVSEYPETGKVGIRIDGQYRFHRVADQVEHAFPDE